MLSHVDWGLRPPPAPVVQEAAPKRNIPSLWARPPGANPPFKTDRGSNDAPQMFGPGGADSSGNGIKESAASKPARFKDPPYLAPYIRKLPPSPCPF